MELTIPPMTCAYELVGVIDHVGMLNNGHYIATCRLPDRRWIKFDDHVCDPVEPKDVIMPEAYILLFFKPNNFVSHAKKIIMKIQGKIVYSSNF